MGFPKIHPPIGQIGEAPESVGSGFKALGVSELVEIGDQYHHPKWGFIAFPLEKVGTPIPEGQRARRLEDRPDPNRLSGSKHHF